MYSLINLSVQSIYNNHNNINQSNHKITIHSEQNKLLIGNIDSNNLNVSIFYIDLNRSSSLSPTLLACLNSEREIRNQSYSPKIIETFIVNLKVLLESDQICLITSDGQLSLCPIPNFNQANHNQISQFDGVGCFEDKILGASWSPDDELLVIITGSHKLILLTKSFDVLCEQDLNLNEFGTDQPVSLGWGNKSTQFHGSLGKSAANEANVNSDNLQNQDNHNELDLKSYQITWRGDGAFFAIATPRTNSQNRSIKVYSRTATLSSTSTDITPLLLHGPISWRPEGSIISSAVYDPKLDLTNIIFFERNGLTRYGFSLKIEDQVKKVWGLEWNSDSTILAVGIEKRSISDRLNRSVQLWTRNNYHWYLKQEVQSDLNPQKGLMNFITWDQERPLRLYIGTPTHIEVRAFSWEVFTDPTPIPNDSGSVAVVDGYQLLLTPLRYQIVPPPMSSFQLSTITSIDDNPRMVNHVTFSTTLPIFATITPNGLVKCYQWNIHSNRNKSIKKLSNPIELMNFTFENLNQNPLTHRQLCISTNESLTNLIIFGLFTEFEKVSGKLRDGIFIQKFGLNIDLEEDEFIIETSKIGNSFCFYNSDDEKWWKISCLNGINVSALVQTERGTIIQIPATHNQTKTLPNRLPEFCPTFNYIILSSSSTDQEEIIPIGLSDTAKLYFSYKLIANDCSSFTIDSDYLIYSNFLHRVKFLDSKELYTSYLNPNDNQQIEIESIEISRAVERGSRIITSIPSNMKLILQMPRGNLETIYPRPMVLRKLCNELLFKDRYFEAFLECRKHKIDFNLIVDFDLIRFMEEGLKKFVEQVNDIDHLNLFLSNLKDINVTEQLYPITNRWKNSTASSSNPNRSTNKVNSICALIVETINQKPNKLDYVNTILTAFVCKRPPDYRSALNFLSEILLQNVEKVDDAIKYIIFLSDANELYNVALSMYDLPLVVLIAQYSQKDPKEYLPFLQSLRELEEDMRKFKIDDYLGNYQTAIKHLCTSIKDKEEEFDKVLKYVQRYCLYEEALKEIESQPNKVMALRDVQGDWLMENQKYMEAALVYTLAGKNEKALEGFRQAEAWHEFFSLLSSEGKSLDESSMVIDMAQRLEKSGRYLESATVLFEYAEDVEGGIEMLCNGRAFTEAIRQAFRYKREDLISKRILVEIEEYIESLIEEIEEIQQHTQKQVERLAELKLASELEPDAFYLNRNEKETAEAIDGIDAMTEATTIFRTDYSRYTRGAGAQSNYSTRSARSSTSTRKLRKKEEKKKAAGKKGSIYEEEYLLKQLSKITLEKLPLLQNQVKTVLPTIIQLVKFNKSLEYLGKSLQDKLYNFQTDLILKIKLVWDIRGKEIGKVEKINEEGNNLGSDIKYNSLITKVERPIIPDYWNWKLDVFN
ncbi:hypothetical protein CROQUDRAFT_82453 [Cronartium quercuum f. sp. fusiforme G11]|uniref:Elongator complex protein 1 n=1 Tax=Cronartium quercuum f. sp. fusiforme G11 TaxID=708437 RepID=A0A9P6N909_9BASI|nr:hypothetical protein CROQUDRAFT_82453 [Cronartium quercuum f. sp. fusiforme G11]